METKQYLSYLRVSTLKQGVQGLGIEAQRQSVTQFLRNLNPPRTLLREFVEQESGKETNRPVLLECLSLSKEIGATIIFARIDRLARNAAFLLGLQDSGCDFIFCDMPNADRFTISILACVAQKQREDISTATKAGLAVARQRLALEGRKLGNPRPEACLAKGRITQAKEKIEHAQSIYGVLRGIQETGLSTLQSLAEALNRRGYRSPRGSIFTPKTVQRVFQTMDTFNANVTAIS